MLLWRIHLVWTSHANVRARSLFQTPVRSGGPTLIAPHARTVRSSSRQGKAASRTKTPPVGNSSVSEYKEEFKGDGKANGNNWQRRFRYLAELAWGLCVVHCVRRYVMETCYVSGPSMQPTIQENSVLLIDKVGFPAYGNKRLRRGDVVVVKSPDHPERSVVKRVTGLPGDWIQVRPPSSDPHNSQLIDKRSELVPEGHLFLEGDNASNSMDSRMYGSVPQALVEGVVLLRIFPLSQFGRAMHRSTEK